MWPPRRLFRCGGWAGCFLDAAFQPLGIIGQLGVRGRQQISVEPTVLFDGPDGPGGELETDGLTQRIGQERGLLNIGQKPPARLIVRVAYVIA